MLDRSLFRRHLEDDETVSRVVHKHWLMGLKALAIPTVALLVALYVTWVFKDRETLSLVMFFLLLLSVVWWLRSFFDYFLDAWIITDTGVIDVAWHGFFHRESSRILYSDIQGVSYEIHGVLGTLMRFGTVSIEKVSTGTLVSLEYVSRPRAIEALILRNMETYLHSKNMKDARQVQDLLATLVADHMNAESLPGDDDDQE